MFAQIFKIIPYLTVFLDKHVLTVAGTNLQEETSCFLSHRNQKLFGRSVVLYSLLPFKYFRTDWNTTIFYFSDVLIATISSLVTDHLPTTREGMIHHPCRCFCSPGGGGGGQVQGGPTQMV